MFEAACEMYGTCIGEMYCKEKTVDRMMSVYNINEEEAVALVEAAFEEWVEAYE